MRACGETRKGGERAFYFDRDKIEEEGGRMKINIKLNEIISAILLSIAGYYYLGFYGILLALGFVLAMEK